MKESQASMNQDSIPIDQMIDCQAKFARIVKAARESGTPFTDT
jgi:hypothetical protein